MSTTKAELDQAQADLDARIVENETLAARNAELERDLSSARAELDASHAPRLAAENESLRQQVADRDAALTQASSEHAAVPGSLARAAELQEENSDLRARLDAQQIAHDERSGRLIESLGLATDAQSALVETVHRVAKEQGVDLSTVPMPADLPTNPFASDD